MNIEKIKKEQREQNKAFIYYLILLSVFILLGLLFSGCEQENQIQKGEKYLYHFNQSQSQSPFEKPYLDTVIITDIQGDYVQFITLAGSRLSTKKKYFNERVKPIEPAQIYYLPDVEHDTRKLQIIEIDSCEYLIAGTRTSRVITHKGNCKFCESRKQKAEK